MSVLAGARDRAQGFFDDLWERGDPWGLETSPFEAARSRRQLELLSGRRYEHVLEIGCGADAAVAVDVSAVAIARARTRVALAGIDFGVAHGIKVEEVFQGTKDETPVEVLMSLFQRPAASPGRAES